MKFNSQSTLILNDKLKKSIKIILKNNLVNLHQPIKVTYKI
jgi:hypothetical protein